MPINLRQIRSNQIQQTIVIRLFSKMFRLQIILHRPVRPTQIRSHTSRSIERSSIFQARAMFPIIVGSQTDKRIRRMRPARHIASLREQQTPIGILIFRKILRIGNRIEHQKHAIGIGNKQTIRLFQKRLHGKTRLAGKSHE